jgi:outer membrane protein with beta-barrel domain
MNLNAGFPSVVAVGGLLLHATSTFAQGVAPAGRGRVGLGVAISDVGSLIAAGSENTPPSSFAPTIFVPITVTPWFRLEPEVGISRSSFTETISNGGPTSPLSGTVTTSTVHVGTGAFGVTSRERFTLYYGARVGYLRDSRTESATWRASERVTIPGFFFAPAIGGEYFLSDHVSLGAEMQVRFSSWDWSRSRDEFSGTSAATHGAVVLRFYFPK